MLGNNQEIFYKMLGQELTKARTRMNMSQYDLAKFSGEQWTTINKMEAGGKFMAHHFVWIKKLGINLNILMGDLDQRMLDVPGYKEETSLEQKESYANQIEESDEDGFEDEGLNAVPAKSDISSLF